LGSNLNSYLTGNVILDENSEPFSSTSTIIMATSQHSSFTEEHGTSRSMKSKWRQEEGDYRGTFKELDPEEIDIIVCFCS